MQTKEYPLKPSANLRLHKLPRGGSHWLNATKAVETFLNLTLSIIHPDLFKSGALVLQMLWELETTMDVALEWESVYTGIQIISNCITLFTVIQTGDQSGLTS